MSKPKAQVVRLKTLDMRGSIPTSGPDFMDTALRAHKRRIFTEDEWTMLQSCTTENLRERVANGVQLVAMLENYSWMNITHKTANALTSNLHYQMDAIESIIRQRGNNHG